MSNNDDNFFYTGYDSTDSYTESHDFGGGISDDASSPVEDFKQSEAYRQYVRMQMDSMVDNYRQQHRYHPKSRSFMASLSETPYERAQARTEAYERMLPLPDSMAESIHDQSTFSMLYPDTRPATKADAIPRAFIFIVLGVIIIVSSLSYCINQTNRAQSSEFELSTMTPVDGIATRVIRSGHRASRTSYYVTFDYTFEGKEYHSSTDLSTEQARSAGVTNVLDKNKEITVYVDPYKPEHTMLAPEEYPWSFFWFMPLIGIVLILLSVKFVNDCKNGKHIIYYSRGVKRFRKTF